MVKCPACSGSTHVIETRSAEGGAVARRRRECVECGQRFTTFERREPDPLYVVKRDGARQRFDRTKLRAALLNATHKRRISPDEVERIVGRIESAVEHAGGQLPAQRIGELCLAALGELDRGAYLQFAGTLPDDARPDLPSIAAVSGETDPSGSVRAEREHAELPPKPVQRRDLDE
jgi:transcriptional repressor NrdR